MMDIPAVYLYLTWAEKLSAKYFNAEDPEDFTINGLEMICQNIRKLRHPNARLQKSFKRVLSMRRARGWYDKRDRTSKLLIRYGRNVEKLRARYAMQMQNQQMKRYLEVLWPGVKANETGRGIKQSSGISLAAEIERLIEGRESNVFKKLHRLVLMLVNESVNPSKKRRIKISALMQYFGYKRPKAKAKD
jgi:hypothetical protein